jgi:hypothetical protein
MRDFERENIPVNKGRNIDNAKFWNLISICIFCSSAEAHKHI